MLLVLLETGQTLLISLLALVGHQLADVVDGTPNLPDVLLIVMHMGTQLPTVVVVEPLPLLVVLVTEHGAMESILLDLPMSVLSVSSSVYLTIQPSNKLVSTSRNTMTSQSRPPVKTSQSQSLHSPTLLLMIISSETSSLLTTRSQHQFRSTLFLSSWVVVI